MKTTRFVPLGELIFVEGRVWDSRLAQNRKLQLALDTAAAETIITPEILDGLGYNPRHGDSITVMRSAVGREEGYMMRVARFSCLGFAERDFRIHVHDLPDGWELDGLLGLSFLHRFDYQIRSLQGQIIVERATS